MSRMPEVGDVVDEVFLVEETLDEGNFGVIFRVRDRRDDRTMALKVHKPTPDDEEELRQRFEREARLIYSLDHAHVVEVLYYGETGADLPYMAMECLSGTDLKNYLRSGHRLESGHIRRISMETLSALRAAHDIGIVHRDLKPSNIFLVGGGESGNVKVLDFGFAKSFDDQSDGDLTNSGTLVGSPAYMSPELVHKQDVGPHSDLYSMGLILAEMVAGRKIVEADSIYDTLLYQASDDPVELPDGVGGSAFGPIVERAVRKSLDERYESATEMMRDLEALPIESPASTRNETQPEETPRPTPDTPHATNSGEHTSSQEIETVPRSLGPRELDETTRSPDRESGRVRTSAGTSRPGRSPSPPEPSEFQHSRGERTSTPPQSGSRRRSSSPKGERRSRTSDGTTMDLERDETREWTSRDESEIDGERPTSSADPDSSLAADLVLGLVLGLLGLGAILAAVSYV